MLAKIKLFFDERLAPEQIDNSEQAVQLAACALLFEMVKADFQISAADRIDFNPAKIVFLDGFK